LSGINAPGQRSTSPARTHRWQRARGHHHGWSDDVDVDLELDRA
jgi:hypothetical protein